ncbi:MAG: ABC transporter permease [Acidobacteria bacterium]|nr:ABC transporter permease [Acidobacteriota bacterium]MSO82562.1 ABC transporter permease [Acidobacteriota bacterium]
MTGVGYAFEEAWASVRRAGRSAAVSIGTIAIAFVTLGGFLLVSVNVQRVLDRWLESAEMSVYLHDDLSEELRTGLELYLRQQVAVAAVEYVSKERALERFRADFPELLDVTTAVAQNPFPAVFEVRLRTEGMDASAVDDLTTGLAGRGGVADVRYDRRWLTRLTGIVTSARIAAAVIAGVLMLGAAFTVAAVVRLSLHARRAEIDIMQLVGAPFSYIRGPFIVEGLLLGGAGAAVALLLIGVLYSAVGRWLGPDLTGLAGAGQLHFLGLREGVIMILGGLAVGAAAGTVASRSAR